MLSYPTSVLCYTTGVGGGKERGGGSGGGGGGCCYYCCCHSLMSLQFLVWDYELIISTPFIVVTVMAVPLVNYARKSCTPGCECYVIHIEVP